MKKSKLDHYHIFAQFDAGIICAARTILERSVADEEAVAQIDAKHRDERLLAVLAPKPTAPPTPEGQP